MQLPSLNDYLFSHWFQRYMDLTSEHWQSVKGDPILIKLIEKRLDELRPLKNPNVSYSLLDRDWEWKHKTTVEPPPPPPTKHYSELNFQNLDKYPLEILVDELKKVMFAKHFKLCFLIAKAIESRKR